MKPGHLFLLLCLYSCSTSSAQKNISHVYPPFFGYQYIHFETGSFVTFDSSVVSKKVVDSALTIVTGIFNSREFIDSIYNLNFLPSNDHKCNKLIGAQTSDGVISGSEILDLLYKTKPPKLNLTFERKGHGFGATILCTTNIIADYDSLMVDMGAELFFSGALAEHICHEYMHSLGYQHFTGNTLGNEKRWDGWPYSSYLYNNDIAYRIGWMVYDILNSRKNKQHLPYPYF